MLLLYAVCYYYMLLFGTIPPEWKFKVHLWKLKYQAKLLLFIILEIFTNFCQQKFDYFLNCDYGCIFLEEGLQSLTKHFAKKTLMSTFA